MRSDGWIRPAAANWTRSKSKSQSRAGLFESPGRCELLRPVVETRVAMKGEDVHDNAAAGRHRLAAETALYRCDADDPGVVRSGVSPRE